MDEAKVVLKKEKVPIIPPTTLYVPKSFAPNTFNTIRDVYKVTSKVKNILI
ncbi:hypothetical protein K140096H11_26530 [Bacteroides intestinalis]